MTKAKPNPIVRIQKTLAATLVERDEVIEALLATVLARQNGVILGPPGTAKTEMIKALPISWESMHLPGS